MAQRNAEQAHQMNPTTQNPPLLSRVTMPSPTPGPMLSPMPATPAAPVPTAPMMAPAAIPAQAVPGHAPHMPASAPLQPMPVQAAPPPAPALTHGLMSAPVPASGHPQTQSTHMPNPPAGAMLGQNNMYAPERAISAPPPEDIDAERGEKALPSISIHAFCDRSETAGTISQTTSDWRMKRTNMKIYLG